MLTVIILKLLSGSFTRVPVLSMFRLMALTSLNRIKRVSGLLGSTKLGSLKSILNGLEKKVQDFGC